MSDRDRPPAIEVVGLRRDFDGRPVVRDLHLTVPRGSFYGLLGPNGAGKTTTLRMVTGLLRPNAGLVRVHGIDVWQDPNAAKAQLGILPEDVPLFDRLTGSELLEFHGLLRGLDIDIVRQRRDELLSVLDLAGEAGKLVADYSHGMRKKIGLAAALLHNPRVLLLDEPFESIDPVSARTIRQVLQRYTEAGSTVVFSSHVLTVVQLVCSDLAIINEGQVVMSGTMEEVVGGRSLEDVFVELVGASPDEGTELSWLGSS